MGLQPLYRDMASETEGSSPLPEQAAVASRAAQQRRLYEEAGRHPDRVIPAMFIEDCARCETLAMQRRRQGFYTHFYSTLPESDTAEIAKDDLPNPITSAGPVHQAIDEAARDGQDTETTTATGLWRDIGTAESPGKLCQPPLLHYIEREDCYIHAEPTRVGFTYGLPVFVYKRRQSDDHYETMFPDEKAYLWLCGWLLHANGFIDPAEFTLPLYFMKVADPATVTPKLVSETQSLVFDAGFPGVDTPEIAGLPEGITVSRFAYDKDMYAGRFHQWRRLYFGERSPRSCGHCEVCQNV